MLEVEIDGRKTEVPEGSTVMEAAVKLSIFVPHFCYHKKLSIAANCRMCLVQVEQASKPLPACATPVTNGMKVYTHSEATVKAQKSVMEFLLLNHPLDCPICDQGGECQLQDLSVGYGGVASRYQEEKRVIANKNLGPLVATDMTRCIHCTRCVRFTQEIAGLMELGQAFRGEHAEIMPFIEQTVDTELSGNIIDLCPVGALTSKPFRFTARTWELSRRKSVSPHDGLGANLIVQVKNDRVYRVLPLENEEVNECWLADRDRFSYEALNSDERLAQPLIRKCGILEKLDWQQALEFVATALRKVIKQYGAEAVGALASPHATLEELHLLGRVMRGLGCKNVDFRLRQRDCVLDGKLTGVPWLGMRIAEIKELDRVLVVGSFLRKDHPLLAQRLRQAAKRGTQVSVLHVADENLLMNVVAKVIVAPSALVAELAGIAKAVAEAKRTPTDAALARIQPSEVARKIAASLISGERIAVFLGNLAQQHPQASTLHTLAQELARTTGGRFGFLGEAANSVGGYLANAVPGVGGLSAAQMLAQPRKAYIVLHAEPELDCADSQQAAAALAGAELVVALMPFKSRAKDYAHAILPVAPFTETSGTFISTEGRVQSFNAVVKPFGETRPAWKVLRVLGNLLGLAGFEQESSEAVRAEILGGQPQFAAGLDNRIGGAPIALDDPAPALERVADVPIYFADPLVRRAESLQKTRDAAAPTARMNKATLRKLGLAAGARARVHQRNGSAELETALDDSLPDNCVRVAAGHPLTAGLGPLCGEINVEPA